MCIKNMIRLNYVMKIKLERVDIFANNVKNYFSKRICERSYVKITYISRLFEIVPRKLNMKFNTQLSIIDE